MYTMISSLFLLHFNFLACGSKEDTSIEDTSSNSTSDSFTGMDFVYSSSEGYTPVDGTSIRVGFRDDSDEFYFSADCNSHFGSYTLNEDIFEVKELSATEMGCDTALMEQDSWLASFFTSSPTLVHQGDVLTFTNTEASIVFVDEEVASPDQPLVGITWNVDTYIEDEAATNYNIDPYPTMSFNEDGSFSVFTGCNGIGGTYTTSGNTLNIEPFDMTLIACDEPLMSIEDHLVNVFTSSSITYEIDANRLYINGDSKSISAFTE